MTRRSVQIESLAEFDARIARTGSLDGWLLQSLDLTDRGAALGRVDAHGAVFLGCRLDDAVADRLRRRGALLFPELPDVPFDPYRGTLYDPAELLGVAPARYADSLDARVYGWAKSRASRSLTGTLATALHDQAIEDALDETLARVPGRRLVGVMGGHDLGRDQAGYADAVRLGARLAGAGRVVLTGGGPGAMEAANLGARLADRDPAERAAAIDVLAAVPSYRPDLDAWLQTARTVLDRWPVTSSRLRSVGIPTWFYGHEPPNAFGDVVAKFFANPLREDTLLSRARGGIVVLEGAAGTVQEIFTAATEDYYATDSGRLVPLVLVGRDHWHQRLPAWPLLERLAADRPMRSVVACVDDVDEAAALVLADREPPDETREQGRA